MSDLSQPVAGWVTQLLSAANNRVLAIGRVIGSMLSLVVFFLIFNAAISIDLAPTAQEGHARAENWNTLFQGLEWFVGAMTTSIIGLIAGTNFTEPKPRAASNEEKPNG